MALTIVNEQYPPRKPKLTLTADSLDELPTEGVAEGSKATVGGTEYRYDSNAGWIIPGSQGKELPAFPTENGNYHLKCAVTADGVTLSWVALT